jgi:hypothetical protein
MILDYYTASARIEVDTESWVTTATRVTDGSVIVALPTTTQDREWAEAEIARRAPVGPPITEVLEAALEHIREYVEIASPTPQETQITYSVIVNALEDYRDSGDESVETLRLVNLISARVQEVLFDMVAQLAAGQQSIVAALQAAQQPQ